MRGPYLSAGLLEQLEGLLDQLPDVQLLPLGVLDLVPDVGVAVFEQVEYWQDLPVCYFHKKDFFLTLRSPLIYR